MTDYKEKVAKIKASVQKFMAPESETCISNLILVGSIAAIVVIALLSYFQPSWVMNDDGELSWWRVLVYTILIVIVPLLGYYGYTNYM